MRINLIKTQLAKRFNIFSGLLAYQRTSLDSFREYTFMNNTIRGSSKINRWVLIPLVLGVVLTVVFGFRAFRSFAQVQLTSLKPGTTDVEAIRGWMTIPYISKMYCVPADYLYKQIDLPPSGNDQKSLAALNQEYFLGQPGAILPKIKDAIRSSKPACQNGTISP